MVRFPLQRLQDNVADLFTKALRTTRFKVLASSVVTLKNLDGKSDNAVELTSNGLEEANFHSEI